MKGDDVPKMTFRTRYENYDFLVMSCGLSNDLMTFMGCMNWLFQNYLNSIAIVFIYDILVYSTNEVDHRVHLKVVLHVIKKYQIFSKYRKNEFRLTSMSFLGHIISSQGIEVDLNKTKEVKNWPKPLIPINIRSFLGLSMWICFHCFSFD